MERQRNGTIWHENKPAARAVGGFGAAVGDVAVTSVDVAPRSVPPFKKRGHGMLDPLRCGLFVRTHLQALCPARHPPHWIGSIEVVDQGSGWTPAERQVFDDTLGDAQAQLDETHAKCAEMGFPKERHHVRVIIDADVLFLEDEEGRVGNSFFALGRSTAWSEEELRDPPTTPHAIWGMVYAEGRPERRYPSARFGGVPVCPWLWYTP